MKIKDIQNWVWFQKISLNLKWLIFKDKIRYFIYCRRGWHNVRPSSWLRQNSKDEKLEVSFLRCPYCNTLFFRNKEDKKIYLRLKDQERSMYQTIFGQILKGRHKIKEFEEVK